MGGRILPVGLVQSRASNGKMRSSRASRFFSGETTLTVDPDNAEELAVIAGEVFRVILRYPSETGGCQLGGQDLDDYLARFRDQRLVLIIAPVSEAELLMHSCGFAYAEYGECPQCKRRIEAVAWEIVDTGEDRDMLGQVADLLDDAERGQVERWAWPDRLCG